MAAAFLALFFFAAPVRADSPAYATDAEWWHARRQDATGGPGDGAVRPSLFTGAAETSISIEVPRGTGRVSPSLSLRYSSRAGRGNAGTGWSIELPRIVKSMKYGVDRAQSPAFKVFEFMGEELVQNGPQENGCDRYYSTTELYQKILFCPLTNQWRVYAKSGTEMKFGTNPFSRYTNTTLGVTFEWNLDEVTDTHGLSWKATWLDVGTNFRRLEKISYTLQSGLPVGDAREVRFVWEERPDRVEHYRYGQRAALDKRLQEVTVWLGTQRVRRYVLGYTTGDSGGSMLRSVREYGSADTDVLPATTLDYQSRAPGFSTSASISLEDVELKRNEGGNNDPGRTIFDVLDVNGDGLPDSIDASTTGTSPMDRWLVRYGTPTGELTATHGWNGIPIKIRRVSPSVGLIVPAADYDVFDMNGDGLPDVLDTAQANYTLYLNQWASGSTSFAAVGMAGGGGEGGIRTFYNRVQESIGTSEKYLVTLGRTEMVDVNGDGCVDRIEIVGSDWNYYRNRLCEQTPVAAFDSAVVLTWTGAKPRYGKSNTYYLSMIRQAATYPGWDPTGLAYTLAGFADVNSDGITDFVDKGVVYLGTGKGFILESLASGVDTTFSNNLVSILNVSGTYLDGGMTRSHKFGLHSGWIDVNGDGRIDWVKSNANPVRLDNPNGSASCSIAPASGIGADAWAVYLNTGRGFTTSPKAWLARRGSSTALGLIQSGGDDPCAFGQTRVVDFDGSGSLTFLRVTENPFQGGFTWQRYATADPVEPDLLLSIENGIGGITALEWESAVGGTHGGNLHYPIPVIARTIASSGLGEAYTTTFTYDGPYFDHSDRELRGFARAILVQSDNLGTPEGRTELRFATGNPNRQENVPAGRTGQGQTCTTPWTDGPGLAGRTVAVLSGHNESGTPADLLHEEWTPWETVVPPGLPASVRAPQLLYSRSLDRAGTLQKLVASKMTYDEWGNPLLNTHLGESVPLSYPACQLDETYLADEVNTYRIWASNTADWVFRPASVLTCADQTCATVLRKSEFRYDDLPILSVDVGDLTTRRTWIKFGTEPERWVEAQFDYDAYGNVIQATDEEGAVANFVYADTDPGTADSFAFLRESSTTVALGKLTPVTLTSRLLWDERFGEVTEETGPTGRRIERDLDGFGRTTQIRSTGLYSSAEVVLSNISYALGGVPGNNVVISSSFWGTGPDDRIESRVYMDGFGRPAESKSQAEGGNWITSALRRTRHGGADLQLVPFYTTVSSYTPVVFSETNPAQQSVHTDFDWAGRPTRSRLLHPGGTDSFDTTASYVLWTNTVTDPRGFQTVESRDAFGRLARVEENGGAAVTQLFYSRVGELIQVADPIGAVSVMRYDSRGLRRELEDPDISNCGTPANCPGLFAYDDRGSLASRIDAKGQEIRFQRDELGRVYLKDYVCTTCSEVDVTFSYDGTTNSLGLLDEVSRGPDNVLSLAYLNWPGVLKNYTQRTGNTNYTTSPYFDLFGRPTQIEYPTGEWANYFYNTRGALDRVTFAGADVVLGATYDSLSRLASVKWGNGLTTSMTYSPAQLLTGIQVTTPGSTLLALGYRHDANGNPVENWEDIGTTSGNWRRDYVYDWANRLNVAAHYQPQGTLKATWDFGYDNSGNITFNSEWNGGGLDGSYAYTGAGPHAVTRVGGAGSSYTLSYDLNGSLTAEGPGNWFEYNFDGRTSRMGDTGASPDPAAELTYDGFGDRRVRKVWTTSTGTKELRYFGLVEEFVEGAQRDTDKFVFAWGQRVAMRTTRAPGKTYFLHGDHQGSVSLVTDETGAVAERRIYAPFGAPLPGDGTSAAERFGYTGQELDGEVGLLHLGIRQYNFAIAKFGVGDPLGTISSQGLNPFSYANNRPTLLSDPSGYQEQNTNGAPAGAMDCPGGWWCGNSASDSFSMSPSMDPAFDVENIADFADGDGSGGKKAAAPALRYSRALIVPYNENIDTAAKYLENTDGADFSEIIIVQAPIRFIGAEGVTLPFIRAFPQLPDTESPRAVVMLESGYFSKSLAKTSMPSLISLLRHELQHAENGMIINFLPGVHKGIRSDTRRYLNGLIKDYPGLGVAGDPSWDNLLEHSGLGWQEGVSGRW